MRLTALCFAVRLRPVRSGAQAPLSQQTGERVGAEVRPVVGEDLIDGHVVGPEPVLGPPPEPHQGRGGLVVMGLDVGDSGVVVDRDVQIREVVCPVFRAVSLLDLGRLWWRDGVRTRRA